LEQLGECPREIVRNQAILQQRIPEKSEKRARIEEERIDGLIGKDGG